MLTDYHVHLRPDTPDATSERFFTQANVDRYRDAADRAGIGDLGVSEHVHRFRAALDVWRHPFWVENAVDDIGAYVEFVAGQPGLKVGIEMDFVPGRESATARLLDPHPWDYVIGSVHFIRDAAVDYAVYDAWAGVDSADKIWRTYFAALADAARSGLFDIIAHPDLVKYWGPQRPLPEGDLRYYYEPAVEAFAESGVVVEVSTAGLRKPAAEIYPAPAFLSMCVEAGCAIALSSDAHEPAHVAYAYDAAGALLAEHGVTELAVFSGREFELAEIG